MAWRYHGHVRVSARSPRAAGTCDRCGRLWNHEDLSFQWDYRGNQLQNLRILVCRPCSDDPQPQLLPRILTQDPIPIWNARPEPFAIDGISYDSTYFLTSADGVTMLAAADGVTLLVCSNNNPDGP